MTQHLLVSLFLVIQPIMCSLDNPYSNFAHNTHKIATVFNQKRIKHFWKSPNSATLSVLNYDDDGFLIQNVSPTGELKELYQSDTLLHQSGFQISINNAIVAPHKDDNQTIGILRKHSLELEPDTSLMAL